MPHATTTKRPTLVYSRDRELKEASDKELLEALRDGDKAALDQLVERKTEPLLKLAYRIVNDSEEARDIVQVTFLRLWQNRDRFDNRWSPNTWIYRIAADLAIDHLRSRNSRQQEPVQRPQDPAPRAPRALPRVRSGSRPPSHRRRLAMSCPDWPSLVRRRDRVPEVWDAALEHFDGCSRCRDAALAAEPTLLFRRLPAPAPRGDEIATMKEAVAALRRNSQPRRAPWGAGGKSAVDLVAGRSGGGGARHRRDAPGRGGDGSGTATPEAAGFLAARGSAAAVGLHGASPSQATPSSSNRCRWSSTSTRPTARWSR